MNKFLMPVNTSLGLSLAFVCLLFFIVVSALSVVTITQSARLHFGALESSRSRNDELYAQASRLTLEYSTLAALARIEQEAAVRLTMRRSTSLAVVP